MAETELYTTVRNEASAEFEEKRSVFIGHAKHITSEEEALDFVKQVKKKYYDARHNVYAYVFIILVSVKSIITVFLKEYPCIVEDCIGFTPFALRYCLFLISLKSALKRLSRAFALNQHTESIANQGVALAIRLHALAVKGDLHARDGIGGSYKLIFRNTKPRKPLIRKMKLLKSLGFHGKGKRNSLGIIELEGKHISGISDTKVLYMEEHIVLTL